MSTTARPSRLPGGLYVLCDDSVRPELPLIRKAELLVEGAPRVLQLRMKRTQGRQAVDAAKAIVALCRAHNVVCLINDRVDWALVSDADGAHLGEDDLPIEDARTLLGANRLVGATTRSLEGIERARALGADHVGLGPIFGTRTKTVEHERLGVGTLTQIAGSSPLPIVAIAGITLHNIEDVAAAGAHCAAVASDALLSDDIPARVRALSAAFARGASRRSLILT